MPNLKRKSKTKSFFRPVHLQAIIFLIIYNIVSKTIFLKSILQSSYFITFSGPFIFACIAGALFLYLLRHEDFFHFIKEVEREEDKKEKGYLKRFMHHGKILATLIIATIGGPIFSAITIRLLLPKYKYPYLLLFIGNIFSTLFSVGIAKGIILGFFKI